MTKQIIVIGTAIMTTLLALVALWQFRIVVLYVLISLVLAATFRPISSSESRRNLVTRLLLILQYVVGLGISGLLIFLVGRFLIGDFQQLAQKLSVQSVWTLPAWLQGSLFQQLFVKWVPTPDKLFEAIISQRQLVFPTLFGITQSIGSTLSAVIVIVFLSVYWSINQNHFERLWLSLLPAEQRKQARYVWRTIEHDLGAYTRSEIIQSLLAVLLLGIGYWLLGSRYPALLAVTGAIAWLIPLMGAGLAMVLPLFLGLLTSPQLALFTVLYTLVVLIALQIWVEPRLFKLKGDNPVLTLVIILAMANAFGLSGIIVAPPLSVICQILWRLLVTDRMAEDTNVQQVQVADLREQHARLQAAIQEMEGTPPPLVASSMERLTGLLEKAEPLLKDVQASEEPNMFRSP
jgi:predicted PurR-regulated permease PerM